MQTPEEIAREIADKLPEHPMYEGLIDSDWLIERIASALRAYAAEERAGAIERVADTVHSMPAPARMGFYAGYKQAIQNALVAIRALPETSP